MKQFEKLFLHTMYDIEERLEEANTYTILKASGIIRQLLIDSNCLLDQVNREYKEKIVFRVQQKPENLRDRVSDDGEVLKSWLGIVFIYPDKDSTKIELLKKDDFLKYKLLSIGEHEFTVLEVIKICANKYGGIHAEDIKDKREQLLDSLNSSLSLLGFDSVVYSMHGIMRVCYDALFPLSKKIELKNSEV